MKTIMKGAIREEKGNVLIFVLILLVVGGLILTPLLGLMSTGLVSGQVYEEQMNEYYAADAGVEDAIWKIKYDPPGTYPYQYPEPLTVNDMSVDVIIEVKDIDPTCEEELRYRILSTATNDDGSSTTIDAHLSVSYLDLAELLDNAIVSDTYIEIKNGVYVSGNVTSGGTVDDKSGDIDGTITENAELNWPSSEVLSAYYLSRVEDGVHYYGDTVIDLEGNSCPPGPIYINDMENNDWSAGLGPLYVEGELDITSSDQHQDVTLTLNETLYITGITEIYGPNNAEPYRLTLDLNGQTIFVASPSSKSPPPDAKPALSIDNCYVVGSGCIIAVGDVYFAPKGDVGDENNFVLVMSIDGTTTLQPSGTFYGCVAGNLAVYAKSGENATIIHTAPEGKGLDFPMGVGDINELPPVTGLSILSWQIK